MIRSVRVGSRYGIRRFVSKQLQDSGRRKNMDRAKRQLTTKHPLLAVRIIDMTSSMMKDGEDQISSFDYIEEDDDGG